MSKRSNHAGVYSISLCALLLSMMLIVGYVESMIPLNVGIPGIKLGMSNSVLIFAVYMLDIPTAFMLMSLKVLLSGILFAGPTTMMYGFAGGVLSLLCMALLSRIKGLSIPVVSIVGGVMHNVGQIGMSLLVLQVPPMSMLGYLGVLMCVGAVCGLLTGVCAKSVMAHLKHLSWPGAAKRGQSKPGVWIAALVLLTAIGLVCWKAAAPAATEPTDVTIVSDVPALEGLLFTLQGNELSVCGYDLEKGVKTVTQVQGLSDGAVILNAQKVFAIVRNFPDCDITFRSDDKYFVTITGGMSEYSIHGLGSDAFPSLPMLGGDTVFTMTQALLKEIIQSTNFAVAQTDARPILTGQLFQVSGSALTVAALDNYRLALRSEKNAVSNNDAQFSLVVPGRTLAEFSRLLADSDEPVTVEFTNKYIIFKLDGVILFSRLLEGDFLDYERAIPKENRVFVRLKTREFIDCVERASLLVDEKLKTPLRCRFTDGNLNISCSTQYGRVNDNIHADKQGDDIEIGFNHRYLLDALRAVRAEEIIASLSTPLFSMILSPADEEEDSKTLYLVVPVRLKD